MGEIVEQAAFWDANISPVLGYNESFVEWLNICDQNEAIINTVRSKAQGHEGSYRRDYDLGEGFEYFPSHSFSIQEDPYEDNKINGSRCFAAVYDPDDALLPKFTDIVANFAPSFTESDLAGYMAYGLGIDAENNEKKVYLVKDITALVAWTFKDDKLIESKTYKADEMDRTVWRCEGDRGVRKRIGFSQDTDTPVQESYENLTYVVTKYDATRDLARKILSSNLFFLDNISHSAERGTTLYFD
jgi:hypothetical protein